MRRVVLIETPYSGKGTEAIRYLSCCLLDSILKGEAPIASHIIYPVSLPENEFGTGNDWPRHEHGKKKTGREIGKECHGSLMQLHQAAQSGDLEPIPIVAYIDLGESPGMKWSGKDLEKRILSGTALDIWNSGNWPSLTRWSSTNEPQVYP